MKYWVLDDRDYKSHIAVKDSKAVISNGLVSRTIEFEGCKTSKNQNFQMDTVLISEGCSVFWV